MSAANLRVAVICDFAEENWPSMDLVGDMLYEHLRSQEKIAPRRIRPSMRFGRMPGKAARVFGRFATYPRLLRKLAPNFDLFHIVDHSYAHLVHELPAGRTIVTCHDLDTFRCLFEPDRVPRSFAFRAMTGRILTGLQAAAHVVCPSAATRDAILEHRLLPPERLSVVHNGVHPALSPLADPVADDDISRRLQRKPGTCPELLHVGSTIPRKRIDVLLQVLAMLRQQNPSIRLIRIGDPLTSGQTELARNLGVREHIDELGRLDVNQLGACYRRASLLLQPSEAEGFGLPVIEGMACGTPVIASDIAALREVGGSVAAYCSVADVAQWSHTVSGLLDCGSEYRQEWRRKALQRAASFTWTNYAGRMADIYRQVWSA
jgi:glycosyltransferase involved in cell wall biosynthesis